MFHLNGHIKTLTLAASFAVIMTGISACDSSSSNTESISISLSGDQENPPVTGNRKGSGNIKIDTSTGAISGSITVENTTGNPTAAHIHGGDAGKNGGVMIALTQDPNNPNKFTVPNGSQLNAAQLETLLKAGLYINVHTQSHPAGEVRGQIIPDTYKVARVELSGANQVPPNASTASGHAYVTVETSGDHKLRANIKLTDLNDAKAAHIHMGAAGASGKVVVGFTKNTNDGSVWELPTGSQLTEENYSKFLNEDLYINIHSPAFPKGELRGQIKP
ncbi:MAG: hypothetical protein DSZ29_02190 [Aquificaceae bacterium]|nr:MAG: hypothetical protein DSZ29_02190 [Aquificaceae bacterium]